MPPKPACTWAARQPKGTHLPEHAHRPAHLQCRHASLRRRLHPDAPAGRIPPRTGWRGPGVLRLPAQRTAHRPQPRLAPHHAGHLRCLDHPAQRPAHRPAHPADGDGCQSEYGAECQISHEGKEKGRVKI